MSGHRWEESSLNENLIYNFVNDETHYFPHSAVFINKLFSK